MSTVQEIQAAITQLELWDKQIAAVAKAGKLDSLIKKAKLIPSWAGRRVRAGCFMSDLKAGQKSFAPHMRSLPTAMTSVININVSKEAARNS